MRYLSLWFRHLTTDWMTLRRSELKGQPFVFAIPDHGRLVITATNAAAEQRGITPGMTAADAKAVLPELLVLDEKPGRNERLLRALAKWCIRYAPLVSIDLPDGLIINASGCTHLWGGEKEYLKDLVLRLRGRGFDVRAAMAGTIGTAWAIARFGKVSPIIPPGQEVNALLNLPPEVLRLEEAVTAKMRRLGLYTVASIVPINRRALRRRFGPAVAERIDQAAGLSEEYMQPIIVPEPFEARLPCLEPVRTAKAIEIAIQKLLEILCEQLQRENKGLRTAVLKCYRVDSVIIRQEIGTTRPSRHAGHLFKLLSLKIASIEPALGIELFILEAPKVEDLTPEQEALWTSEGSAWKNALAELIDKLSDKAQVYRYLPREHYWPERSCRNTAELEEKPSTAWPDTKRRPLRLLPQPEPVQVTAPIPDYPPMLFRYQNEVHPIVKSDGPERIEREWWLEQGEHRDYYIVEDERGRRYWLFRSGHYAEEQSRWFIHGFFA